MIAAVVAVILLGLVALFQIALALGAPLGKAAWGGQHHAVLPSRLRVASAVVGLVVYPLLIVLVVTSTELAGRPILGAGRTVMWVLAGVFVVGAVMNLASRSRVERLWAPVSFGIAVSCALSAAGL